MSVMSSNGARPIRVTIQEISPDRRGLRRFMVLGAGEVICNSSLHPILCAASVLLNRGLDPSTRIIFADAEIDFEEHLTLAEAIALEDDVVVPMRRREQR